MMQLFIPGWHADRSMPGMCHIPAAFLNHENSDENKMMWIDHGGIMWLPLNVVFSRPERLQQFPGDLDFLLMMANI